VASPDSVASTQLPAGATDPIDDATAADLEAASLAGIAEAAAPGAIVGVRTPDGTWTKAFGVADTATGAAMTVDDHVRIGSVTKTLTGSMVLQLAEEGELSLDDTIDEYVDGMPNGDRVTLRMLLDMTSGIASYSLDEEVADTYLSEPETVWTPDELIAAGASIPPLFEPGAQFDYSNTNAVLLGRVVEQVTGQSYAEALEERILVPLGLEHTSFPDTTAIPDPHAHGITLQGTPDDDVDPVDATGWSPTFAWSAGQAISTVDDLLAYGRAVVTGQGLLDEEMSVERLTSWPADGGYGLAIGCIDGWVGHTGEIPGYNTTLFHDAANDMTVIVLANSDIPSGDCPESKTLPDTDTSLPCMNPAVRIFVKVSEALGHTFTPNPMQ
jgi:D-alanyl-D-alanine carboxypeptidase